MRIRPIPFYDERETTDRSLTRNFKTKKEKIRKLKINKKKRFSCEFDLFICCTYYTYLVPTYLLYIHEVILSIISFSLKKNSEFFFCFFLLTKSRIGEEKKGKGKKRKKKK